MKKVFFTIRHYNLIEKGDKIVVAVSGGPDSLALAHFLHEIADKWSLTLHIAHLNHMFREEAAEEMAFVEQTAAAWGLPVTARAIDVPAYINENGMSPQEAAREIRYSFLDRLSADLGFNKIAIGHNADDQAETVLMNFLRGSGMKGLAGIPPFRDGKYIRPFLGSPRREIEEYCLIKGLNPRRDPSNRKTDYLRNRVRLELFPLLEKYNPNLKEVLCHTALVLRDEEALLERLADDHFLSFGQTVDEKVTFLAGSFRSLGRALQRRLVRRAWQELLGPGEALPFAHVEKVLELLAGRPGVPSRLQLPRGAWAWLDKDRLCLGNYPQKEESKPYCYRLKVPGEVAIKEAGALIAAHLVSGEDESIPENDRDTVFVSDHLMGQEVHVRSRLAGDRFSPAGLGGSKKLKDFFIDEKVPRFWRDSVPLVTTFFEGKEEIVWVSGYRVDEKWKVAPGCDRRIKLVIREEK